MRVLKAQISRVPLVDIGADNDLRATIGIQICDRGCMPSTLDLGGEVLVGWPVEKERLFSRARWSCHEPDETGLLGDLDRRGWSG